MRSSLNDCWVGLTARTKRAEIHSAGSDREKNKSGEKDILPNRLRNKRHTLLVCELLVILQVRCPPNDSSWHRPFVDSQLQDHQQVHSDESHQQPGDDENVQREKA